MQIDFSELTPAKLWELKRISLANCYIRHPKQLRKCTGSSLSNEEKEELKNGNIIIVGKDDYTAKVFIQKDGILQSRLFKDFSTAIAGVREIK